MTTQPASLAAVTRAARIWTAVVWAAAITAVVAAFAYQPVPAMTAGAVLLLARGEQRWRHGWIARHNMTNRQAGTPNGGAA